MDQVLHMRGVSFHVHWTLSDIDAPHHAEWEGRGPAHSRARIRYELSGDGEGPTSFEYINEFEVPGGRLGQRRQPRHRRCRFRARGKAVHWRV